MSHHAERCPNCQRSLSDGELYCHFCEADLEKISKDSEKKENHGHNRLKF